MATTAAQDKLRKAIVWTVVDCFGNEVICTATAWGHVLRNHPEMGGLEHHVRDALNNPEQIVPSTVNPSAFGFETTTQMSIEIRCMATYDEPGLLTTGSTIGKLSTAYPIDDVLYDTPNIGGPIYVRPEPVPASNDEEEKKP